MKNNFNNLAFMHKGFTLLCCTVLILVFCGSRAININTIDNNRTSILFTQVSKGKINVQVIANKPKTVELYLFNAAGELVKKLVTDTKSINTIQNIKIGQYLYQCFEKDEQLKSGKLIVNLNSIDYD